MMLITENRNKEEKHMTQRIKRCVNFFHLGNLKYRMLRRQAKILIVYHSASKVHLPKDVCSLREYEFEITNELVYIGSITSISL